MGAKKVFQLGLCVPCQDYAHVAEGESFYPPELFTTVVNGFSLDWQFWFQPKGKAYKPHFLLGVKLVTASLPKLGARIALAAVKLRSEAEWETAELLGALDFGKKSPLGWGA